MAAMILEGIANQVEVEEKVVIQIMRQLSSLFFLLADVFWNLCVNTLLLVLARSRLCKCTTK